MERLTNADHEEMGFFTYEGPKNPYSVPLTIGELCSFPNEKYSPREILEEVFARLAAYEDTGLEPEEIKDLIYRFEKCRAIRAVLCDPTGQPITDPSHMRDLLQAEKAGRLVVLPCKVGDTVYRLLAPTGRIIEREIRTEGEAADVIRGLNNKHAIVQVYLTRKEAEAAREAIGK